MKYLIIECCHAEGLGIQVEKQINQYGWKLHGSPFTVLKKGEVSGSFGQKLEGGGIWYCQAVIKEN